MFYINHSFNNNVVGTVCQTKEELISKIDEILKYQGCDTNKFHVSNCEVKMVDSIQQKIENGNFVFDANNLPVFETIQTQMTEEKEIIFEFDAINGTKIQLKTLLSNIQ